MSEQLPTGRPAAGGDEPQRGANGVPGADATSATGRLGDSDEQLIEELARAKKRIQGEIAKRVVGQEAVIEQLLIALFARGHCLFVGVPGLAKTLLISTLAEALSLSFNRIQFTPDLMPSDITGTDILEEDHTTGRRAFRFVKGPVFANVLLADEINRTPPKTQAALLQAMQEKRVTAAGHTYPLDEPFLVFATQNPIEQEGTYPLPEAQLDRFMFMVDVGYPSEEEEVQIVRATTSGAQQALSKILAPEQIRALQGLVLRVPVADHVIRHAVELVRRTRPREDSSAHVRDHVSWGAGPRASQALILGAKARAALDGRPAASVDDVRVLAEPVLRHRVLTNFHAEAEGVDSRAVIARVLSETRA
ncbi:MAG TPA: MoxR family ATPase [Myxococcales bacterium]|jgi:MoxR-like ATPase|nr:MoxR family ATPase [Myxococcales bacterium]